VSKRTWLRSLFARPVTRPIRKAPVRCRPRVEARGVVGNSGRVRLAEGLQPVVYEALARARLFELFETTAPLAPPSSLTLHR
jgi:hypothetical protein